MEVRPVADSINDDYKACNISTQIIPRKRRRMTPERERDGKKEVVETRLHIHDINSSNNWLEKKNHFMLSSMRIYIYIYTLGYTFIYLLLRMNNDDKDNEMGRVVKNR